MAKEILELHGPWLINAGEAMSEQNTKDWRLWKDMKSRKCIGVFDINMPDLERRIAPCLWPLCTCERAKPPPQGAEE